MRQWFIGRESERGRKIERIVVLMGSHIRSNSTKVDDFWFGQLSVNIIGYFLFGQPERRMYQNNVSCLL